MQKTALKKAKNSKIQFYLLLLPHQTLILIIQKPIKVTPIH